jgi:hypothetical protein
MNADYAQQKALLGRLHQKNDEDVLVTEYILVEQAGTDALTSYATWPKFVPALLPRTDRITFVQPDTSERFEVPWAAVERIIGHRMTKTELYPERYRVDASPNDAELRQLRQAAER